MEKDYVRGKDRKRQLALRDRMPGFLYEMIVDSKREIGYNENTRDAVDLTISPQDRFNTLLGICRSSAKV